MAHVLLVTVNSLRTHQLNFRMINVNDGNTGE
jgi:hypothetical protein